MTTIFFTNTTEATHGLGDGRIIPALIIFATS
jgi:hypothetical protein